MSCHLLLHLLHELANMILCEALAEHIIFANECNKFSNKWQRIWDFIYYITVKTIDFSVINKDYFTSENIYIYWMALFHSQSLCYVINYITSYITFNIRVYFKLSLLSGGIKTSIAISVAPLTELQLQRLECGWRVTLAARIRASVGQFWWIDLWWVRIKRNQLPCDRIKSQLIEERVVSLDEPLYVLRWDIRFQLDVSRQLLQQLKISIIKNMLKFQCSW